MAPRLYQTLARAACAREHVQVHKSAQFHRKSHSFIILHCIRKNKLYNLTVITRHISTTFTSTSTTLHPTSTPRDFPTQLLSPIPTPSELYKHNDITSVQHPSRSTCTATCSHHYSILHITLSQPAIVHNERQARTIRQSFLSFLSDPVPISWHSTWMPRMGTGPLTQLS